MIVGSLPTPPREFMELVCGPMPNLEEVFENSGRIQRKRFEDLGLAGADTHLLDVGCGCGRFARQLLSSDIGSYTGFDRHPGLIKWAQDNIASRDPRFRFLYVDVTSPYEVVDGSKGEIPAEYFTFPFEDGSFTAANLASVFTHMRLPEIRRYMKEIARVTRPGATMIFSAFLTDGPLFELKWNVYVPPADLRAAAEDAGWIFSVNDLRRFARNDFKWREQQFFQATRA